jgi:hypothetical protein
MYLIDSRYDSLDGGSACRKATTHTIQHRHGVNADIHASSGIRTHDPCVWAGDDISCLTQQQALWSASLIISEIKTPTEMVYWAFEVSLRSSELLPLTSIQRLKFKMRAETLLVFR